MKYMIEVLIVCLFIQATNQVHTLTFVKDEQALCLDGSKGSFYFERGSGSGSKSWLIYFQGGGWIGGSSLDATKNNAFYRSKTSLGSSQHLSQTLTGDGIFSRDSSVNPVLFNWNSICVNYCDGTGHQGYAKDPLLIMGTKIYFRGDLIARSIIEQFQVEWKQADKIIVLFNLTYLSSIYYEFFYLTVSGCSAGGAASFTWVQTIRDLLPISVTVLHVPDSGIFMDTSTYDGSLPYQNTYHKNFMQLSNKEISPPNTSCILANKNQQWKCLLAEYLIEYINVPIFFVQSPYDSWSIPNVLKVSCPKDGNLSNCNDNEMNFIENYAITMEVMMKSRLSTYQNTGVFAPSCLEHCFLESSNFYGNKFQVPSGSGNTIAKTLSAWILDQKSSNYLDNVPWPENKGCNNLKTYII